MPVKSVGGGVKRSKVGAWRYVRLGGGVGVGRVAVLVSCKRCDTFDGRLMSNKRARGVLLTLVLQIEEYKPFTISGPNT